MTELIPQPHGGALHRNPPATSRASGMRAARREARRLLAELTPIAVQRLGEMLQSEDDRVVVVATQQVLDRGPLGRPGDHPEEEAQTLPDLRHLSAPERRELADALRVVNRLTGRAAALLAAAEAGDVIDAVPVSA